MRRQQGNGSLPLARIRQGDSLVVVSQCGYRHIHEKGARALAMSQNIGRGYVTNNLIGRESFGRRSGRGSDRRTVQFIGGRVQRSIRRVILIDCRND